MLEDAQDVEERAVRIFSMTISLAQKRSEDREASAPVRREVPKETFCLASVVAEELEDTVPLFRPPEDPHATRRIEIPAGALPPDPWDLTQ